MTTESLYEAMHRPLRGVITAEGEARVERGWMTHAPCCNNNCNQGRNCPTRQACELPISFAGDEPSDGMLAKPAFWIGGIVSAIPTVSLLVWWLR